MEYLELEEKKVKLGEWDVNYVVIGKGEHVMLLMPGTLGTIRHNFGPQLYGFDSDLFTLIAWDPPGHGKSHPPRRWFSENYYEEYADYAVQFMKILPFRKYTLLGWCGGGRASIIIAATHPQLIRTLVLWNTNTFLKPNEVAYMARYSDPLAWPERAKKPMIEIYGEEYLQQFWMHFVDGLENILKEKNGEICTPCLDKIVCPTLIIQADKDTFIDKSHVYFMHERITGSLMHIIPEGRHDCHKYQVEEFNTLVKDFLLQINGVTTK